MKRCGAVIAFLGSDGSGKSTLIENIRLSRDALSVDVVFCEHLRPNLLPSLATLFGRDMGTDTVSDPHGSPSSGLLGSLFRLTYYTTDYFFGYWLKVYPSIIRRNCLYVFDRYFYDYFIDPCRSRLSLPSWIVKIYSLIVPKPDIIICLGADAEVLHARKSELPFEELRRQLKKLRQFCKNSPRAVWIDTSCSVDESTDKVLEAITSHMASRYSGEMCC